MKRTRSAPKYWLERNGRLYARLQYFDGFGKPKVKYRRIPDKRSARSVVEKLRSELEIHGEELFSAEKFTFGQLLDKYESTEMEEARYQGGVKISGRRSVGAAKSAAKPLREYFGKKRLQAIKPADIKNYKSVRLNTPVEFYVNSTAEEFDDRTGKMRRVIEKTQVFDEQTGKLKTVNKKTVRIRERKIASVNRELELLRSIFNFAIMNEWLLKNPFTLLKGVISKAAEVERDRVLSPEEEQRLLAVCVGRRAHLRPLLICALDTAMRRGEIFKMRWRDVDFATKEIFIPQMNTKTESARTVGITERLQSELERIQKSSTGRSDDLVFGLTSTIKTVFGSACDEANVKDFRFHDCRHTATTRMIASGSSHTEVMKITGHTQLTTFLRYLNITPETTQRVATNLDDYLRKDVAVQDAATEHLN